MSEQRGFTLTEISVVLAIIGVLGALAVPADPEDRAITEAQVDRLSAELETVRLRAMSSRRWHRVTFDTQYVHVEQSTTTGMAAPTVLQVVTTIRLPARVRIWSVVAGAVITDGAAPVEGGGVPGSISFAPDGRATASTIYISDKSNRSRFRIAVFAATGFTRRYDTW